MAKKGIFITLIFIFSTFIQLLSQIVITRIFGASFNLDVYLAAVAVPTILITVIYGTFNDAFLPLFGELKIQKPHEAEEYFVAHTLIIGILTTILVVILSFSSELISSWLYGMRGPTFVQEVSTMMRYLFWAVPFAAVATLFGSYYYAHKHFLRFPVAQAVGNFAILLFVLLLAPFIGIWSLVISFIISIILQVTVVIPRISFFTLKTVNIVPFLMAAVPLLISSLAIRSDTLLIRSIGSNLPTGSLVYLNLVTKIFLTATNAVTIGIQVLLLPHLVEYLAEKDIPKVVKTVNKAKTISIGISTLTAIAVVLIGPLVIRLVFVGGNFTNEDAGHTIAMLPLFVLPAIAWGINSVFFQPLIALKKQYQLGILNLVALGLGWWIAQSMSSLINPMVGIITGLSVLLFTGIIGSEILWQYHKRKLQQSVS